MRLFLRTPRGVSLRLVEREERNNAFIMNRTLLLRDRLVDRYSNPIHAFLSSPSHHADDGECRDSSHGCNERGPAVGRLQAWTLHQQLSGTVLLCPGHLLERWPGLQCRGQSFRPTSQHDLWLIVRKYASRACHGSALPSAGTLGTPGQAVLRPRPLAATI